MAFEIYKYQVTSSGWTGNKPLVSGSLVVFREVSHMVKEGMFMLTLYVLNCSEGA